MAGQPPDPRTFTSADEAFQYPVVAVKGLEKKLRRDIDENQEKLRTLVGASYRDLLGTARTIVDIHGQMQDVERVLVDIGRRSDSRLLDKKAANFSRLEKFIKSQDFDSLAQAAQLSLFQDILNVITKLLRTQGSSLLAAKLLVISRLLQKSLSSEAEPLPLIKTLGKRLASLRQKLLHGINRRLSKTKHDSSVMVEDLTAFALATSSTPSDMLRHFLRLRAEVICHEPVEEQDTARKSITRRLSVLLNTLRDAKAIFPDVLAASLRVLGARPLLEDPAIVSIHALGMDVRQQWLTYDVRNYAPYARHDELTKTKTDSLLSQWSQKTLEVARKRVEDEVQAIEDLQLVVEVRRDTLQLWLSSKHSAHGVNWAETLSHLRTPFLNQMRKLVKGSSEDLQNSVCNSMLDVLQRWKLSESSEGGSGLWNLADRGAEFADGAHAFRGAIIERRKGHDANIGRVLEAYDAKVNVLLQVDTSLKTMKEQRWEDDYDFDDDDDDTGIPVSDVLSKSDPQELEEEMRQTIVEAVRGLESSLVARLKGESLECKNPTSRGLFVLRSIRELRHRLPALLQRSGNTHQLDSFAHDVVSQLHYNLSTSVTEKTASTTERQYVRYAASKFQATSLWAGNPPLPVQPIPATFALLRTLNKEMQSLGYDLWTSEAVGCLKDTLVIAICVALRQFITELLRRSRPPKVDTPPASSPGLVNGDVQIPHNEQLQLDTPKTVEAAEANHSSSEGVAEVQQAERLQGEDTSDSTLTSLARPTDGDTHEHKEAGVDDAVLSDNDKAVSSHQETAIDRTIPSQFPNEAVPNTSSITDSPAIDAQSPLSDPTLHDTQRPSEQPTTPFVPPTSLQAQAKYTQLFFDTLYLANALSSNPDQIPDLHDPSNDSLQQVSRDLAGRADLDEASEARIRKAAKDYWRRTYLLFGLLSA